MTSAIDVYELRHVDADLDDNQRDYAAAVDAVLDRRSTSAVVRASREGFDASVHAALLGLGLTSMSIPSGHDPAATLGDSIAVVERCGAHLAPAPFVESVVATRLLVQCRGRGPAGLLGPLLDGVASGAVIAAVALYPIDTRQVVPAGSIADVVLGVIGDDLVVHRLATALPHRANHADAPIATWSAPEGVQSEVLVEGGAVLMQRAIAEWRVLTAAAVAGAAATGLSEAVEFAKVRRTRGIAIGSLQSVSHALADAHIGLVAARNLARKAAWYLDHEPSARPELPPLALGMAARAASDAVHTAVHVQGGQGVSLEADVTLAFTRARGWALVGGSTRRLMAEAGHIFMTQLRTEG